MLKKHFVEKTFVRGGKCTNTFCCRRNKRTKRFHCHVRGRNVCFVRKVVRPSESCLNVFAKRLDHNGLLCYKKKCCVGKRCKFTTESICKRPKKAFCFWSFGNNLRSNCVRRFCCKGGRGRRLSCGHESKVICHAARVKRKHFISRKIYNRLKKESLKLKVEKKKIYGKMSCNKKKILIKKFLKLNIKEKIEFKKILKQRKEERIKRRSEKKHEKKEKHSEKRSRIKRFYEMKREYNRKLKALKKNVIREKLHFLPNMELPEYHY